MHRSLKFLILLLVTLNLCVLSNELIASEKLRSAFLGPNVWKDGLTSRQINQELRDHFAEVIRRLEAKNASSLLTALRRAEATSLKQWSKSDRKAALIYLANNREKQISRLHSYMHRGLFPINEGQATEAVPIFVDQRKTHCAVGYLMHVDGCDNEIAAVVKSNNLVKVMGANFSGLSNWVRASGLTREEAAMIQPAYPVDFDASFQDLLAPGASVQRNQLVLSNATVRGSRFQSTLPASFATDPGALQAIFEQGRIAIDANDVVTPAIRDNLGVVFGATGNNGGFTSTDSLYLGASDSVFGVVVRAPQVGGNTGIVEFEYELRSHRGNFSQVALASYDSSYFINEVDDEASALLVISEIFDADSDQFLGNLELSAVGTNSTFSTKLVGSESIDLNTSAIRIKSYAMSVGNPAGGGGPLNNFFNEFETSAVPEPSCLAILLTTFGLFVTSRRRSLRAV